MFRSRRRSILLKRLWKYRLDIQNPNHRSNESSHSTESGENSENRSIFDSFLSLFSDQDLEILAESVESGSQMTKCVAAQSDSSVRQGPQPLQQHPVGFTEPHVVACKMWRWPNLEGAHCLRQFPTCHLKENDRLCCNPYHWSQLLLPDSPPPPYSRAIQEPDGAENSCGYNTESFVSSGLLDNHHQHGDVSAETLDSQHWCTVAYWELRQRVGRLFTIYDDSTNVCQDLPHGNGICLSVFQGDARNVAVQKTRDRIGSGVILSRDGGDAWICNCSDYPIFVNSPLYNVSHPKANVIKRLPPGFTLKIYSPVLSTLYRRQTGVADPCCVQVSFVKGWGPHYSRQFVTSCPCWLELLLNVDR